jgi:hypothetical protein
MAGRKAAVNLDISGFDPIAAHHPVLGVEFMSLSISGDPIMKTLAFLLIVTAAPALAQESAVEGSIFDALEVGDWVRYTTVTNGSLIDITVVNKPAHTTIEQYRKELAREREEAVAFRNKSNEIRRELQTVKLADEERAAKEQLLQRLQRDVVGRGGTIAPYEVSEIRKEYVVLSSETLQRFIAKSAVRMIVRNLPAKSAEADK